MIVSDESRRLVVYILTENTQALTLISHKVTPKDPYIIITGKPKL